MLIQCSVFLRLRGNCEEKKTSCDPNHRLGARLAGAANGTWVAPVLSAEVILGEGQSANTGQNRQMPAWSDVIFCNGQYEI